MLLVTVQQVSRLLPQEAARQRCDSTGCVPVQRDEAQQQRAGLPFEPALLEITGLPSVVWS